MTRHLSIVAICRAVYCALMIIPGLDGLAQALATHALRQRVLANDLANAQTPGFRAQDIDETPSPFAQVLNATLALARTDGRHLGGVVDETGGAAAGAMLQTSPLLAGAGGNGVDPEATLAALSENALSYQALTAAANGEFLIARTGLLG
jgi:flagellar basal-body rod protein FlgB